MSKNRKCARCGNEEFRIDGYCSIYCRDLHDLEQEHAAAMREKDARIAELERALRVVGEQPCAHILNGRPCPMCWADAVTTARAALAPAGDSVRGKLWEPKP